eukprot:11188727-Lingulodinium_polyedra.AAC.1
MHQHATTVVHCQCWLRRAVPTSIWWRSHTPNSCTVPRGACPHTSRVAWAAAPSPVAASGPSAQAPCWA